jgi:hypothetical protein
LLRPPELAAMVLFKHQVIAPDVLVDPGLEALLHF